MLEKGLSYAFRDLWTYILIAAVITIPLHFVYAVTFRNVIAVAEVHDEIEGFSAGRTTRDVGPSDLDMERAAWMAIAAIELALLPLAARATRRALERDIDDKVPTAIGAWAGIGSAGGDFGAALKRNLGPLALAALLALTAGFLAERAGMMLSEVLGIGTRWVGVALAQGLGRAIGAPLFLVPWALAASSAAKAKGGFAPKLY